MLLKQYQTNRSNQQQLLTKDTFRIIKQIAELIDTMFPFFTYLYLTYL